MNVTDANRYINALNRIAEGATMLAASIEIDAWGSLEDHAGTPGVRPIAAAELVQPAFEVAAEDHHASSEPSAPVPEPMTLEQVRTVLARLSQAGHTAKVRELIQTAGADKLSEVDPTKYGQLLEQAEAITDA